MTRNGLSILLAIACLCGCTMAPRYTRPAPPVPTGWPNGPAYKQTPVDGSEQPSAAIGWRGFYADEKLQAVIDLALRNNRDLRIAASNVEKARALYRVQRAELFPVVAFSGALTRERVPADVSLTGGAYTSTQYSLDVGITSWEIDFFGRIRSLKESALEQYLATEEAQLSTRISLIAEVANAYLARAADKEGLELARSTLEARQTTHGLIQRRFEIGVSSALDLRQAETVMEAAQVDVARYTGQVALDENALNLLVGSTVPAELMADDLGSVIPPKEIWAGLSSDVLLSRPDVLQSEDLLKAADANIGAARAAFFPRVALTSSVGTVSTDLSRLFRAGSGTWLFAPQIDIPIFDAGTRRANLQATEADRDASLAQYERSIQTAFRETADALAQQGTLGDQIAAQTSLVSAAADAYRLSDALYIKGIDNYLVVLDSQRSLYSAQQGLISLRLARLSNLVTLYKVLGGR